MARYDKYDPYDGGFRAQLASAIADADAWDVIAVGLDSQGRVVPGAGQTGIVGALVAHGAKKAGDIVDVMTDGEIVEFDVNGGTSAAGTRYYGVAASGALSTTDTDTPLGFTAEASRLIVRVAIAAPAGA